MNDDIAIKVNNVSKVFHEKAGSRSFKEGFVNIGRKITGNKEKSIDKGDFTALKDISFEVKKGEFFGIVGRNGSGKSTLLKILAGVYTPSNGGIAISGKLTPFIELGVGFNPELSGKDNVFLNGVLLGFTRKQMEVMYDDIVAFAELEQFMDMKLKHYSSGMQVRLAFSVAIRAESDILLIDEVLAVGDINFQKKCFEYFKKLKEDKRTVIFVSHDMSSIKEYCDNAILIEKSRMVQTSGIKNVIHEYMKIMNPLRQTNNQKDMVSSVGTTVLIKKEVTCTDKYINLKYVFKTKRKGVYYSAYSIKDNIDQRILGSSTEVYNKPLKLQPDQEATVTWSMHNVLSRGTYSINISIFNDQKALKDTFEDVLIIENNKAIENYFSVNPVVDLIVR